MTESGWRLWEREAECAAIADAVKAAVQGQGSMVLVQGPAGIGKSRLLREARTQAREAGVRVAAARAGEMERDFAFGVVRQLFEPLLTGSTDDQDDLWAGPAAQARPVFQTTDQPLAGDFAVLHGLYWLTANASQHHPLLLAVDDLQWCDAPSLRFLAYLLPRIDDLSLLAAVALRTGEPATDERLLAQLTTDPAAVQLHPAPLSEHASTHLLSQTLTGPAEEAFTSAFHQAAGGNPLLLHALARTLADEQLTPTAANAHRIEEVGPRAVSRLVTTRLASLPEEAGTLAQAVAVLGDHTELATAAALAEQDTIAALRGVSKLEQLEILRTKGQEGEPPRLSFVHPLVRAAVHDTLDLAARARWHQRAAHLLAATPGADPERTAAHLLHISPAGDPQTVAALQAAAAQATARGAPDSAYTYLHRCLQEPPSAENMLDVLVRTGTSALMTDTEAAVHPLRQALAQATDPSQRTQLHLSLGGALLYLLRPEEALQVYRSGLREATDEDSKRCHAAAILSIIVISPKPELLAYADELTHWPPNHSLGGRALDAILAFIRACQSEPDAVTYALRALSDDQLARLPGLEVLPVCAWWALLTADRADAFDHLDQAVARAHRIGLIPAPAYDYRGLAWLWQGHLAEAEADSHQAMRAIDAANAMVGRAFNGFVRAEEAMARGDLTAAEASLKWAANEGDAATNPGQSYLLLGAQAHLLRLRESYEQALKTAQLAGQRFAAHGGFNPAFLPWRSEAALNLLALGRTQEARTYANEELTLTQQWGAPRALGHALRVAGLLEKGPHSIDMLSEAVTVLEGSPARLEHARALAAYGAALRRLGHRQDARPPLRHALDLATRCGATPLAEQARTELAAAGGRPRHTALTGPSALTPSERRIAELAATGKTNRQIAQALFVTPKTVEVHLSSAYRKLDINSRAGLPQALASS